MPNHDRGTDISIQPTKGFYPESFLDKSLAFVDSGGYVNASS